jgi:hypothetical protein
MMNHPVTVSELIAILQGMPQDMPVQMSMNMEYQGLVCSDMVEVFTREDGSQYVLITDCPGAGFEGGDNWSWDEDDGQPNEAQEWHDFDPDC